MNDVKFFYKKSIKSDGVVRVWLNGNLVFEHYGKNLLKTTERGYTKFGQYTEIRDERIVYYDAVEFCHGPSFTDSTRWDLEAWTAGYNRAKINLR